jgi:hypothetical protein
MMGYRLVKHECWSDRSIELRNRIGVLSTYYMFSQFEAIDRMRQKKIML